MAIVKLLLLLTVVHPALWESKKRFLNYPLFFLAGFTLPLLLFCLFVGCLFFSHSTSACSLMYKVHLLGGGYGVGVEWAEPV